MFIDYKADVERPLPMIYQSGYLTVKDYDPLTERYLLDFPNNEVRKGFLTMLSAGYLEDRGSLRTNSWLGDAALLLMRGRTDDFRESLTAFLSDIPYDAHESVWRDAKLIEKRQSKGRVDCILEMKDYVYIFELKLDGSPQEALRQIEEQGYARSYAADGRRVFRIGVNFSSETRTIDGWAEA